MTPATIGCGRKASRCGSRHVSVTRASPGQYCVHEVTGHAGAAYAESSAAVSTSHGAPPTVTKLSAALAESAWPVTVSVPPSLAPELGEVAVRRGVCPSA